MNSELLSKVKSQLQSNWVDFIFTKKDGNIRAMTGTTCLALIPEEFHPRKNNEEKDEAFVTEKVEDPNPVITVFEKDKGWRSFRLNQLNTFNGENVNL